MKGDFTRSTFKPEKHYSGVRMQQGRVALDADWNEQIDIAGHRTDTEAGDVIGPCGAPMHQAGFALVPVGSGSMLQISPGHYYVDGILCENEQAINLDQQPDLPGFTLPTDLGFYIAYLDVWQRHITILEDGSIREVALGGPDTATRTKTVWQVKLLGPLPALLTCQDEPEAWQQLLAPKTDRLSARAQETPPEENLCIVPPGAGFRRLENQLYRIEVHTAGGLGTATFTWSRDNGSIVARWLDKKDDDLIVSSIGRDQVLGFAANQWVELTDDRRELQSMPGTLVRLKNAEGQVLTIDPSTATGSVNLADFTTNPKIRRWDSDGALTVARNMAVNDGFIKLEDGVEVKFEPGSYHVGDYWLIPARTTTGDVEWPRDHATPPQPVPLPPAGIDHHFCRLAIVQRNATGFTVLEDCRHLFPPLTEVSALHYVSGDGQEVMPNISNPAALVTLPQPLQVGVANRAGATVRFQIMPGKGNGRLQGTGNSVDIATASTGIASCTWELDSTTQSQQVEARLLSDAGQPLPLPVRFTANLSVAAEVAYDPSNCPDLAQAEVRTVQAALDRLCQLLPQVEPGIPIIAIKFITDDSDLDNDVLVPVDKLLGGLQILCDGVLSPESGGEVPPEPPPTFPDAIPAKPTCFVTLDLPYLSNGDVVGFQPLILGSTVSIDNRLIKWIPRTATSTWVLSLFRRGSDFYDRVLAHLTVKGNFIWQSGSGAVPTVYLDGDVFGRPAPNGRVGLHLPSGNGRRGGDFEMWFWLAPSHEIAPDIDVDGAPHHSLDFGSVNRGDIVDRELTVRNTGNAPLRIDSIMINVTALEAFSVVSPTAAFTVAPNDQRLVTVRFSPPGVGQRWEGDLRIASNDPDEPTVTIRLLGTSSNRP